MKWRQVIEMSNKFAGNCKTGLMNEFFICVSTFSNHSPQQPCSGQNVKHGKDKFSCAWMRKVMSKFYKLFLTFHTHNLINRDIRICLLWTGRWAKKVEFEKRDDFIVSKSVVRVPQILSVSECWKTREDIYMTSK